MFELQLEGKLATGLRARLDEGANESGLVALDFRGRDVGDHGRRVYHHVCWRRDCLEVPVPQKRHVEFGER